MKRLQGLVGVSKFARHELKHPYFYAIDGDHVHILARLSVPEKEFWEALGKALRIKFVGWEGDTEQTVSRERKSCDVE